MRQGPARHWLILRFTAVPLVPLFAYFILNKSAIVTPDRAAFIDWLNAPVATMAVPVFLVCAFYHAFLGVQEVIEDYVHGNARKICHALNAGFFIFLTILSAYTLYQLTALS